LTETSLSEQANEAMRAADAAIAAADMQVAITRANAEDGEQPPADDE